MTQTSDPGETNRGTRTAAVGGWLLPTDHLLYASGAFGFNVFHQTLTLWLMYFYAPPAESGRPTIVPLATLGLLLTAGRVIEAFDDPAIGHWSDSTRSRWGRRLPFVAGGAPLMVLTFVLLWTPPTAAGMPWTAVYAFIATQLYFLAASIVHQPYEAVLAEIAREPSTRVRVSSWKVAFGTLGAAVGLVGSGLAIGALGFPGMGLAFGLLAAGSVIVSAFGIRRLPHTGPHPRQISLIEGLRLTATNRQFLVFVGSEVLFFLGLNMLTQLVPYFVTVILREPESMIALVTGLFAGVSLLALPAINWLAARRSKTFAYTLAMGALVVMLPGLYFVGSLPFIPITVQGLVYIALLGVPMSALQVLPNPFVADIVDDDETRTGLRREGVYYGVEETIGKLGFALSTAIFGVVLGLFGFSGEQPLGIRLIGPIAGFGVLVGLLLFRFGYHLPEHIPVNPAEREVATT